MKIKEPFIPLSLARLSIEILASYTPYIRIYPSLSSQVLLPTESKLLGIPYWPKSFDLFPKDKKGGLMKMVAQLNFQDIQKTIELSELSSLFPQTGLLQFFLPQLLKKENMWGTCYDSQGAITNDIAVIYHPHTQSPDLLPESIKDRIISEKDYLFPVTKECELKFSLEHQFCPLADTYHAEHFYAHSLDTLSSVEQYEFNHTEEFDSSGFKIHGYAHFTQGDFRTDKYDDNNPWILLLQLGSFEENFENICSWGDDGVANWFIRKNDLLNRDFSKIVFYWDCQ